EILRPEASGPEIAAFYVAAGNVLSILLSGSAAWPGYPLSVGYGAFRRRILERGHSSCLCVLRDIPFCPNAPAASDRARHTVAASTNISAQSESVRSQPRQHSRQYIPQRACRGEPRCCSGASAALSSSRFPVSAAFDRDCRRCALGPLSLRTGRVIRGVAGDRVILNGAAREVN